MDVRYLSQHVSISDELKEYMEPRLEKLSRYFHRILDLTVVAKKGPKNTVSVEITVNAGGALLRAEHSDSDLRKAFDLALKTVEKRVRRHKEYLVDRVKACPEPVFEISEAEEPEDRTVVREKVVDPHPMDVEEAALQMDLLGHAFYLFRDMDGVASVVYRRDKGGYGVLKFK